MRHHHKWPRPVASRLAVMVAPIFVFALGVRANSVALTNVAATSSVIRPHMGESTNVSYNVDQSARISAWVKNQAKVTVRTLANYASQEAGTHTLTWDGKNTSGSVVPAGGYTVWIRADAGGQNADAFDDVVVDWPESPPTVSQILQAVAFGHTFPGSNVTVRLNGASIGTTTSDLRGLFQKPISNLQSSNTLVAEASNPITGALEASEPDTFEAILNVSVSPDPFDPSQGQSATISYTLPSTMTVTLEVIEPSTSYPIRTLVDGEVQNAGSHSVSWDGKNDSGVLECAGRHVFQLQARPSNGPSTAIMRTVDSPGPRITDVVIADATTSSVTVTWTTNTSASSQVQYGLDESLGSQTTEDTNMVTAHSVTVSGLTFGETYYFRVLSQDSNGKRSVSGLQLMTAAPLPSAPSEVQIVPKLRNIAVNWTAGGSGTSSYMVYRGNASGFTCDESTLVEETTECAFTDMSVSTGSTYYYRVKGKDSNSRLTLATSETAGMALSPPTSVVFLEAESAESSAVWTGDWTTTSAPSASGGAYRRSDGGTDCAVEFTVTGPEFDIVFIRTEDGGLADIYIDGFKLDEQLDFGSGGNGTLYRQTHLITGLANASHTIKIQYSAPGGGGSQATYLNIDLLERHVY